MSRQVSSELDRRGFLGVCSMVGLGQTLLPGALFTLAAQAEAQSSPIMGGGEDVTLHCVGRIVRHERTADKNMAAAVIDDYSLKG